MDSASENGTPLNSAFSGITYYKTENRKQEFIVKAGCNCYIGTFNDTTGSLNCNRAFTLNYALKDSTVLTHGDNTITNFSDYIPQGISYYNNTLYVPLSKPLKDQNGNLIDQNGNYIDNKGYVFNKPNGTRTGEKSAKEPTNASIVLTYQLTDNTGNNTVSADIRNDLFFRVTSTLYSNKFEIECVDVDKNGTLYFNANREKSNNTANDSVSTFNDYTDN